MEDVWLMGEEFAGRPRRLLRAFFPNDIGLHCDHGSVNTLIKRLQLTLRLIHPNAHPRNRLLGQSEEILAEKTKYILAEYMRLREEQRAIVRDSDRWAGDDDDDDDDDGGGDNQRFGHAAIGDGDGGAGYNQRFGHAAMGHGDGGDEKGDDNNQRLGYGAIDRGDAGDENGDGTGGGGNHGFPKRIYNVSVESVNRDHGFQDRGATKIAIELEHAKITIIIE